MAVEPLSQLGIGAGLHLHVDGLTGELAGDGRNGDQIVLTQPAAGEGVWGDQLEIRAVETSAAGWADPGFKGGLGEIALQGFLVPLG